MMLGQNPYADILTLPHHKAANRPQMSMHDRTAQFSPFAALTGFDGVIAETGRMTDQKAELSESLMTLLNQKLTLIDDAMQDGYHPRGDSGLLRAGCKKGRRFVSGIHREGAAG